MTTPTISAADTAYLLRKELGPLRQWSDFLSDAIRHRQSINGMILLPCCRQHDGRSFRPRYNAHDVKAFICAVKAAIPTTGRASIRPAPLKTDPSLHWKLNKFDQSGNPVAYLAGHLH